MYAVWLNTERVYHIQGHHPLQSPGNDEADMLAQVWWTEHFPSENIAHWLTHAGQKTMWPAVKAPRPHRTMSDITQACHDCNTCSRMRPKPLPEMTAPLARGHNPHQRWQVDYIGPLLCSEGARYALTCVQMANGLMQVYLVPKVYTTKALTKLVVAYGQKKTPLNGDFICCIIQWEQASN